MTKAQTCWLLLGIFCLAYFAMAQDTVWQGYDDACKKARKQRDYAEAEKQCLAALKEAKTFGTEDVRLATTLNSLATLYHARASTPRPSRSTCGRWPLWKRLWGQTTPTLPQR